MDKQYMEQFDISRRYLNGTLSPEERIEFEEYILDKPEIIEQLELDRVILAGLKKQPVKTKAAVFWQPWYSHSLAAAASVALVAVLLLDFVESPTGYGGETRLVSPEIVYLETFRSQELRTEVAFYAGADFTYLIAAVPSAEKEVFTVSLHDDSDNEFSMVLAESVANSEGDLVITLDKNRIKSGMYSVVVSNASNEAIKQYSIEIAH